MLHHVSLKHNIFCDLSGLFIPDSASVEDYLLASDLPCRGFRNFTNVDRVAKFTVVIDCAYHNITKVNNIWHLLR